MRTIAALTTTLVLAMGLAAATARAEEKNWRDRVTFTLSDRLRGEFIDWFEPPRGKAPDDAHQYGFVANQLRVGAKVTLPHVLVTGEMQYTQFFGLPADASLAAPQGNLGPGAAYYSHTRDREQGEPFVKQANLTIMDIPAVKGLAGTVGRFEYSDGLETIPADPSLAWIKRARIGERLIGPFGYTHVTRSQDGVRLAYDQPSYNVTAFGSRPSQGGFEVSANPELDIWLGGLAVTLKQIEGMAPLDVRGFYIYYRDNRDDPVKADNRASPSADRKDIGIHTLGTHAITVAEAGPGKIDGMLWGALQAGDWGKIDHFAWAYSAELGYQLTDVFASPWLRGGITRTSGDSDPGDGDHETFFQLIPTARVHSQTPFFNLMNIQDVMAQLVLKPDPSLQLRADYHWLGLTESKDRWYAGGGATNKKVFGFSAQPTGGRRELAHFMDFSAAWTIIKPLTMYFYVGHAFGQAVVKSIYRGSDLSFAYAEFTYKY